MTDQIRSNSVLPGRREDIRIRTEDGLDLVGELALPLDEEPVASLLTLHPLPTAGGFMDSHLLRKASWRLPALADLAVLRFNTRGTASARGRSGGVFDSGVSERYDVRAALAFASSRQLPRRWVVGWSFGADLALKYACDTTVEGVVLLSPPLRSVTDVELDSWAAVDITMTVLVPELDDFLRPDQARERFARVPRATVVPVQGAKHLWVGEKFVQRALNEIVGAVRPGFGPLPTSWDGPMGRATVEA